MCCPDCAQRMSQRRVETNRKQMELERYEYVAVYGKTTISGDTFTEVADQLAALGFILASATAIAQNTIRVPHPKRKAAAIQKVERSNE
jgi:hypothetical protein